MILLRSAANGHIWVPLLLLVIVFTQATQVMSSYW